MGDTKLTPAQAHRILKDLTNESTLRGHNNVVVTNRLLLRDSSENEAWIISEDKGVIGDFKRLEKFIGKRICSGLNKC